MRNGDKTHCKHGHEFTEENTYWRRDGYRQCRACEARLYERRAEKVEVRCPECGESRLVQRRTRERVGGDGRCQRCAARATRFSWNERRRMEKPRLIRVTAEHKRFWRSRFSQAEIDELWAEVSLYLPVNERGEMAA